MIIYKCDMCGEESVINRKVKTIVFEQMDKSEKQTFISCETCTSKTRKFIYDLRKENGIESF